MNGKNRLKSLSHQQAARDDLPFGNMFIKSTHGGEGRKSKKQIFEPIEMQPPGHMCLF